MSEKIYHKVLVQTTLVYFICIFLMFLTAVLTRSGIALFIIFVFSSLFIVALHKNYESLSPFFIALLMNNALVEYPIGLFGDITLTGIIKIFYFFYFFVSINSIIRNKRRLIGCCFFLLWILYFTINALVNKTGVIASLFSISFTIVVCLVQQNIVLKSNKQKIFIISGVLAGFIFLCLCGYFELMIGKTFFYSTWTGAERYRFGIMRIGSTVSDPNFLALIELFSICFLCVPTIKKILGHRVSTLLICLGILSILLTFSRTGIIAMLIVIMIIIAKKRKKFAVVILPIIALIILPVINFTIDSLNSLDANSYVARNRVVLLAVDMWKAKPMFGNGMNYFYNVSKSLLGNQRSTMNEYVGELVNYGLIGLGFFLSYFVMLFKKFIGRIQNLFTNNNTIYYFAILISWLLMSYSLDTFYKILIWVLPSLIISVNSLEKEIE